jgi:hypothetical protein
MVLDSLRFFQSYFCYPVVAAVPSARRIVLHEKGKHGKLLQMAIVPMCTSSLGVFAV